MVFECPGSRLVKQPVPEIAKCPSCSEEVEIWTDEVKAKCPRCKTVVLREMGQSCLDWCKYAKECVGEAVYTRYARDRAVTVRDKLLKELEEYFGEDKKRIAHARKVLGYAEELLKKENGDFHIVIPASILHDVGIKISEEKYGSSAGHYQEKEGPIVARKILLKFGLKLEDIDQICEIIAYHHTPGKIESRNFKILYDADMLVNLKEEADKLNREKFKKRIAGAFLTSAGREMAEEIYLKKKE